MSLLKDLPKLLRGGIRRYQVPGAALAIHRRGRLYETAAGVLNVDSRVSATPDSVFQIGSITKIFTTTLVMQLVDEGTKDCWIWMRRSGRICRASGSPTPRSPEP